MRKTTSIGIVVVGLATAAAAWAQESPTQPDPHGGKFSLMEATAGLGGKGPLVATLETSHGTIPCTLAEKEAPISVANFVGLARGLRAFWDPKAGKWAKRPFYNGLSFHRVIPGFMIQGGDLNGNGTGQPGYTIKSEAKNGLRYDVTGRLAMARRQEPDSAGAQFFITDGTPRFLDDNYTVFGTCAAADVVAKIARLRGPGDRPTEPVTIRKVTVKRGK